MLYDVNARYGASTNIFEALYVSGLDCDGGWLRGCVALGRGAIAPLWHVADVIEGLSTLHKTTVIDPEIKICCATRLKDYNLQSR